ncbi:acetyl-CoA carboxylase biotin carboxyl carrier protein [Methylohalomonas lacus]|uniref:Biotin carboxyl carrier protein of acetyl-CoA carboxylase n=1 Tax=Methylohalomonas lacus TaxID=398773 RepID=A0AAE3L255_9GAMM|nr:acetyl-CoA carboxylase biotin carboxyl carrier protein [Methylohalomonas lacus]MCS3903986.1 acetyl-CoA carboxylase biotin carboxyl carrier protein [Methylohalomonas lacus]
MDIRKVKKLIELLEESGIAEIEIHEGEESVRISRQGSSQPAPVGYYHAPAQQEAPAAPAAPAAAETESAAPVEEGHIINAPMVGTFYSSPSPGSPAFVDVGQPVAAGEVICIIEAMKIMNQIECEINGTVSKVLVENGEPVEYGQPMFVIKPAS